MVYNKFDYHPAVCVVSSMTATTDILRTRNIYICVSLQEFCKMVFDWLVAMMLANQKPYFQFLVNSIGFNIEMHFLLKGHFAH